MTTESTHGPVYVPSGTRNWATLTLVLAILTVLFGLYGFSQLPKTYAAFGADGPIQVCLSVGNMLVAVAFIAGCLGVLKGKQSAREIIEYAAIAGMVLVVLAVALVYSLSIDPHYFNAILQMATSKAGPNGVHPTVEQVEPFMRIMMKVTFIGGVIFGVIQIVYLALLYRHISAEPDEVTG